MEYVHDINSMWLYRGSRTSTTGVSTHVGEAMISASLASMAFWVVVAHSRRTRRRIVAGPTSSFRKDARAAVRIVHHDAVVSRSCRKSTPAVPRKKSARTDA